MKIAINTLGPSKIKAGIGNYVVNLVKELSKIDKTSEYTIFANEDNAQYFNSKNKNFQTIILPKYTKVKFLRVLWEQLRLPFLLKKMQIDLLHSPGFVAPLIKTTKSVVTIHDMTFFSHPECHTASKVMYFKKMIPHSAKKADAIIADSDNTKKEIQTYLNIPRTKITTIYLGAGPEFKQCNKEKAKSFVKKKYGVNDKFILFVGMIEPRKNLQRLVDAFLQVKEPSLRLVIVGEKGWQTKELFNTIKELKLEEDIIFTGYVPDEDLVMLYNAAETFVYPSLYEGFGIPIVEAMACGCPVITSNSSSLKEIAGTAAILVNPHSTDDITNAIQRVVKDNTLKEVLSKFGIQRAKMFTWKKTAEQTLDIYNTVFKQQDY